MVNVRLEGVDERSSARLMSAIDFDSR